MEFDNFADSKAGVEHKQGDAVIADSPALLCLGWAGILKISEEDVSLL